MVEIRMELFVGVFGSDAVVNTDSSASEIFKALSADEGIGI
jgi:hypothetical protein